MTALATYTEDKAPTLGLATDTYEYDAFGNEFTVPNGSGTPNEFMYRGEQWDSDLGLYYLRARYYNPLTGRFMSRDPEDGKPFYPETLHKYLYAGGDPVNMIDPRGREEETGGYLMLAYREFVKVPSVGQLVLEFTGCAIAMGDIYLTSVIPDEWPSPLGTAGFVLACGTFEYHAARYLLAAIL